MSRVQRKTFQYNDIQAIKTFKGTWNKDTNVPLLNDGEGTLGDKYLVVEYEGDIGLLVANPMSFSQLVPAECEKNDMIIYNGSHWVRIDTKDTVNSVFGRQGDILPAELDYSTWFYNKTTTDTKISDEATLRTNADNTLQTNIDNEVTARTNADNTLQTNIDNEATSRTNADNTLQTNIDNEVTARTNADNTLQSNIDAVNTALTTEITNRTNGDSAIQADLDTLELQVDGIKTGHIDLMQLGPNNFSIGANSLDNVTTGVNNVAYGISCLLANTTGNENSAFGHSTMEDNVSGSVNLALGHFAMRRNISGDRNTACGWGSLHDNLGNDNTALGHETLYKNTGSSNTAVGRYSLFNKTSGNTNIALGFEAGKTLTTGASNIYIGSDSFVHGLATESNVIRIGNSTSDKVYFGGINPATASDNALYIDADNKVGIFSSSERYKHNIETISDDKSSLINDLRPVSFTYKTDDMNKKQYGLIAEEVDEILPELVIKDGEGLPNSISYHKIMPLMLNEIKRLNRRLDLLYKILES